MTYGEAMAAINRRTRVVARKSAPELRIMWRFGRPVWQIIPFIIYTPTRADMRADDWELVDLATMAR